MSAAIPSGAAPGHDQHGNVLDVAQNRPAGAYDPMYPDSDGKPMAENELQLVAMIALISHLMAKYRDDNVHVGGDQFWYPVQGSPEIVRAPDVYVVFGRPQLPARPSWRQWEENNQPPDFVAEILSPSTSVRDRRELVAFYERYGVREYVAIDPQRHTIDVYRRLNDRLELIVGETHADLIGIRFALEPDEIVHYDDLTGRVPHPRDATLRFHQQAEELHAESARAERLAEQLRTLGVEPLE
jgi:Uma2 family endonuclease